MSRAAKKHKKSRAVTGVGSIGLVMLLCDHPKCPRKKKVPWDDTMPEGTATIATKCPWHAGDTTTESYYDASGRWFGPDGWTEQHNVAVSGDG